MVDITDKLTKTKFSRENSQIINRVIGEICDRIGEVSKRIFFRRNSFNYETPKDVSTSMIEYLQALFHAEGIKIAVNRAESELQVSGYN